MSDNRPHIVLCNGASAPKDLSDIDKSNVLRLEYRERVTWQQNVKMKLPDFVQKVYHLPDRILDLLEIASYVYAADRREHRGARDAVEYHSWARDFHFIIRVRDDKFWLSNAVANKLSGMLQWMSGDRSYQFTFLPGHATPATGLFDREEFCIDEGEKVRVALFSGGLDSLAGVIELLESGKERVCLVSHQSGPATKRTQRKIVEALESLYPNRVRHYGFECSLKGSRAVDENQRTRTFLYCTIALALATALSRSSLYVFENGITSLNFSRRADLINARASRTTHPKTLWLLQELFTSVREEPIKIINPYLWKTKTDVITLLHKNSRSNLISSTVSCSRTFKLEGVGTHCGGCFQCIDRKLAVYSSGLEGYDDQGIYAFDFISQSIQDGELRTTLIDYIRQAKEFAKCHPDKFYYERISELTDIVDYVRSEEENETDTIEGIWNLCQRHGQQVLAALQRIRERHDDLYEQLPDNSLLRLVSERAYLKTPVQRLVEDMCQRLSQAIPMAFKSHLPAREDELNDQISAILNSEEERFDREYPTVSFALAKVVPDHTSQKHDLLVEGKFVRGTTTPSKASEGIAADLTKYPENVHILFVVYDPFGKVVPQSTFKNNFENRYPSRCTVCIIP